MALLTPVDIEKTILAQKNYGATKNVLQKIFSANSMSSLFLLAKL